MATCETIIHHYRRLLAALATLTHHINEELANYPCWVKEYDTITHNRDKICQAFNYFQPGGPTPQHTFACPGVLAGNAQTHLLLQAVNSEKQQVRIASNAYLNAQQLTDTAIIRELLAHAGFPGVKLRQVYRHIRCIDFHPRRVSFTRVKHTSHRIIGKQEALERVAKAGAGFHISVQEDQLRALDQDISLVIHRDVLPIWACNISTFKNQDGKSSFSKILTSIPLVYLHLDDSPWPVVTISKPISRHQQKPRADKKIEDNVFLPSISAYRYK